MSDFPLPYRLARGAAVILREAAGEFDKFVGPVCLDFSLTPAERPSYPRPKGWHGTSVYLLPPTWAAEIYGSLARPAGGGVPWHPDDPVPSGPITAVAGVGVRFLNTSITWTQFATADEFDGVEGYTLETANSHFELRERGNFDQFKNAAGLARTALATTPLDSLCAWWANVAYYHRANAHFVTLDPDAGRATILNAAKAAAVVCRDYSDRQTTGPLVTSVGHSIRTHNHADAIKASPFRFSPVPSAPVPSGDANDDRQMVAGKGTIASGVSKTAPVIKKPRKTRTAKPLTARDKEIVAAWGDGGMFRTYADCAEFLRLGTVGGEIVRKVLDRVRRQEKRRAADN